MPAYDERFHRGLPAALFFNRDGTERRNLRSPNELRPDELDHLKAIRDRMLDLYFPPSVKHSWGKPEDDRGWLGVSTFAIGEDGKPIGTRTYKPGHRRRFQIETKKGTVVRYETTPYVWVPDDARGRTFTKILDDGTEKNIKWTVWERSLSAWISHFSGEESMLAFWDDRRGDDLTCILFDIDGPYDPSARIGEYMRPWVNAVKDLEVEFGVDLKVNWMLSGSKGVWGQIFLDGPLRKSEVAALLTAIALRVERSGFRVRLGGQTAKHLGNDPFVSGTFSQDKRLPVAYTLDDGSIGNRNCRLPWASHHNTRRIAHFVLPDGSLPESQVDHLFQIERVSAEMVSRVAREVAGGFVVSGPTRDAEGSGITPEEEGWDEVLRASVLDTTRNGTNDSTEGKGSSAPEDRAEEALPSHFTSRDIEGKAFTADGYDHGNNHDSTEGKDPLPPTRRRARLPRYDVPRTKGQKVILLDDYLEFGDDDGSITGLETIDEVLPMMYGAAWDSLSSEGGLLRVYDWLIARGEPVTETAVVELLMSRYVGHDMSERRNRFATMVRSDISRGKHLRAPRGRRAKAMAAERVARGAGISNETTIRILQGICTQSSSGGRISTTSETIARVVRIIPPTETDLGRIKAAKVKVGEHIKKLMGAGLLIRHEKGFTKEGEGFPSVYEVFLELPKPESVISGSLREYVPQPDFWANGMTDLPDLEADSPEDQSSEEGGDVADEGGATLQPATRRGVESRWDWFVRSFVPESRAG